MDATTSTSWEYVPANPAAIKPVDDYSHLLYARGYVIHTDQHSPVVPDFWLRTRFADRIVRWDPRGTLAAYDDGQCGILIFGHALHSELGTTDMRTIGQHLLDARREGRQQYLDALEDQFGQFIVVDREGDDIRFQTDAIGLRAAFHNEDASLIAAHVRAVGLTLNAPDSKWVEWVSNTRNNDFPGRATRYEGVWQLLPNSEVQLGTGKINRVGPRPYTPLTVEQAADLMVPILERQVEILLSSGRQVLVSASAGVDSRTSLAAFA
ncbi:hypothetical protein [Citricoccus muralis]|uniref:Uncharacterized protein n=1 Tax=Citricoccus muralis TaxID=169134 RepID=A0ABY8H6S5_9MICC|nr:hypothetical protein [Citricoccus muralis]WFP16726.1 hypothetical protein P8192_00940 [Citricoccus muralis]